MHKIYGKAEERTLGCSITNFEVPSVERGMGLRFEKGDGVMRAWTDSDWAGDVDSRRSTTGHIVSRGNCAISWSSKLQKTVAQSSAEAEYYALSAVSNEVVYQKQILDELNKGSSTVSIYAASSNDQKSPIEIFSDSQSGMAMARSNAIRSKANILTSAIN